jgi:hypothetical protein
MRLDAATIERLAEAIHERYRTQFAPDGPTWSQLDADLREANRDQARDLVRKVASVGASVEPGPPVPFTFTPDEVERLAIAEHRRWMAERRRAGWRYAAVRDNRRRHHPLLVKWEKLSEQEREKDRDAVRNIPEVLARVGLRVVREPRRATA